MKVIIASFAKCGTKTLRDCLRILGYTVYDFDENFMYLGDEWMEIFEKGASVEMFTKMYKNIDAVSDLPACVYWQNLHEAFPNSKIILTTRKSEEAWTKSWNEQAASINGSKLFQIQCAFTPTGRKYARFLKETMKATFECSPTSFDVIPRHDDILRNKYREHNMAVQQKTPNEKLLVFNLSDGWKPLCNFLDKDVPDVPFPHSNKRSPVRSSHVAPMLFRCLDRELLFIISFTTVIIAILIYNACLYII
ncbi:uncharacterized protein LOC120339579 [Styela clava]|uniref:uncharacterized protein LOC120339579 n=1 Tax=Styela clava TaxID=7725 RepID=UPI001939ABCF|nr:uncharacterized protein LOC120339579 [Styela clava]